MVCVWFLDRQGPPRPARRRTSGKKLDFPVLRNTSAHERAARRAKSRNEAQTNHKHTRSAAPTLLSDRGCVVCPLARARLLGGERGSSAARSEERKAENTREPRTATKESGLPLASPHAACAAPRAACVARPFVVRTPRPPAVSGSGANGAGARGAGGSPREAQDGRSRQPGPRTPRARGARTPTRRARRVARRMRRAPARDARAPAGVWVDRGRAARGATE